MLSTALFQKKWLFIFLWIWVQGGCLFAATRQSSSNAAMGVGNAIADIIEKKQLMRSVVTIYAKAKNPLPLQSLEQDISQETLEDISYQKQHAIGTGFFIRSNGVLLTNYHVIEEVYLRGGVITVLLFDEEEITAKILAVDPASDIAILKIPKEDCKPMQWGDSDLLRIGETVFSLGNPMGLGMIVSSGIVSSPRRAISEKVGSSTLVEYYIQSDAPISSGSSGGPLLTLDGKVVGVNTAVGSPTRDTESLLKVSISLPSNVVTSHTEQLLKKKRVTRGCVGLVLDKTVSIRKLNGDSSDSSRLLKGVIIKTVLKNSSAQTQGVLPGDVVIGIDNQPVRSSHGLRHRILRTAPGKNISFKLLRSSGKGLEKKILQVVLQVRMLKEEETINQPTSSGETTSICKSLGMTLVGVDPFGLKIKTLASNAAIATLLQREDILLSVDKQPITDAFFFDIFLKNALDRDQKGVLLEVNRKGKIKHIFLSLHNI